MVAVQRWWRGAGLRRRCTGQNITHWNNWRTGFGKLSPTSHMTSCRRLWIPSPVVWEAGGCCRCLRWILSYASIFPFKKVHVKIIFFCLCFGNIEVMTISQCLLISQPPCIYIYIFIYLCICWIIKCFNHHWCTVQTWRKIRQIQLTDLKWFRLESNLSLRSKSQASHHGKACWIPDHSM